MKYLLTLFAILLAIFFIKKQMRANQKSKEIDAADEPTPLSPRQPMSAVPMVACAHCGLFVEKSQSLEKGGRNYCSAEHMQADVGGPS